MPVAPDPQDVLQAAIEAARWGRWAAWAAWASVGVTLLGLFFIVRQLKATEDAASAAWMTARPWLEFDLDPEGSTTRTTTAGESKVHLSMRITVTNKGTAPALDVSVSAAGVSLDRWNGGDGTLPTEAVVGEPLSLGAIVQGGDAVYVFHAPWFDAWSDDFSVAVICTYLVPGLKKPRSTAMAFNVHGASKPQSKSTHGGSDYETTAAMISRLREHRTFMT